MPFSAPYSTSTPEGTTRGRMTTGGHPGDGGVFQPEAAPVQTGHIGRGAAHGTSLPDPTNRPPKSPVCYFRTASSSRQACSQRRQACSQARQCWKWGRAGRIRRRSSCRWPRRLQQWPGDGGVVGGLAADHAEGGGAAPPRRGRAAGSGRCRWRLPGCARWPERRPRGGCRPTAPGHRTASAGHGTPTSCPSRAATGRGGVHRPSAALLPAAERAAARSRTSAAACPKQHRRMRRFTRATLGTGAVGTDSS